MRLGDGCEDMRDWFGMSEGLVLAFVASIIWRTADAIQVKSSSFLFVLFRLARGWYPRPGLLFAR